MRLFLLPALVAAFVFAQQSEADRILAEIDALQARFAEPPRPLDKDWVKRRLAHLYEVDQLARGGYMNARNPEDRKKIAARVGALDRANTAELKLLLENHRWFTIGEFGKEADLHAWVLVQHADRDPDFQRQVLDILAALQPLGETSGNNFANLFDRVAHNAGRPQRYGTQGRCAAPGLWQPYEIEDPANLDARRASVGLSTMAEYLQRSKDRGYCP